MIIALLGVATVYCLLIATLQPDHESQDTFSTWWVLNLSVYTLLVLYRVLAVFFYIGLYVILSRYLRTIKNEGERQLAEDRKKVAKFKQQVNIFFSVAIPCTGLQLIQIVTFCAIDYNRDDLIDLKTQVISAVGQSVGFLTGVIFDAIIVMLLIEAEAMEETQMRKQKIAEVDGCTLDGDITESQMIDTDDGIIVKETYPD